MDKKLEDSVAQKKPKRIRFCFDVSGSMYRFNGYDNRLQRSIESALLVMEGLHGKENKIRVCQFSAPNFQPYFFKVLIF